jgi:hypothetical protein
MEKYYFMNSYGNDKRVYDAQDFAFVMQQLIGSSFTAERVGTGVSRYYKNTESEELLKVTANGTNMATTVSIGAAAISGQFYELTEPKQLFHQSANSNLLRVDRIVLRLDNRIEQRKITLEVKAGTPSNDRIPPGLTWTDEIKEIALASVDIVAGRSYITQEDVLDTRSYKEVCGFLPLHNIYRGINVDSTGITSFPNNSYVASEGNTTQVFKDRTESFLNFQGNLQTDARNEVRNSKFSPQTSGTYLISVYMRMDEGAASIPAGTDVQIGIYVNGTYNAMAMAGVAATAGDNLFKGQEIVDLKNGDELQLNVLFIGTLSEYRPKNYRVRIVKIR